MKKYSIYLLNFLVINITGIANLQANNLDHLKERDALYSTIQTMIQRYKRPITLLELGKCDKTVSFTLAQEFPESVFIMNTENDLLEKCKSSNAKNIILLNKQVSLLDLKTLGECEHFDIVLVHNFTKSFGNFNLKEALNNLLLLGEKIFVEEISDSIDTNDTTGRLNILSQNVTTLSNSCLYLIELAKTKLQRRSWIFPFPPATIAAYSIFSTYSEKYLAKPRGHEILKTPWKPGINLVTYKMLEGIYPTTSDVIAMIKKLTSIVHSDCQAHNLIIQGNHIEGIDTHDPLQPAGQYSCDKALKHLIDFITSATPKNCLIQRFNTLKHILDWDMLSLNTEQTQETNLTDLKNFPVSSDSEALRYIEQNKNAYVALSFPCIKVDELIIENFLRQDGTILYKKYLDLKNNGSINLIRECYKHDGHTLEHLQALHNAIFSQKNGRIIIYVYACENLEKLRKLKDKIRKFYNIKCAIHATDNQSQSLDLGRYLFTPHGIHLLNNRNMKNSLSYSNFNKLLPIYKNGIQHDIESFVVDGSAILSAYGLRDCNDIDYLSTPKAKFVGSYPYIGNHNSELEYHKKDANELIYNINNFFYLDGIKFLSLYQIYAMKQNRFKAQANPKDLDDMNKMSPLLTK